MRYKYIFYFIINNHKIIYLNVVFLLVLLICKYFICMPNIHYYSSEYAYMHTMYLQLNKKST